MSGLSTAGLDRLAEVARSHVGRDQVPGLVALVASGADVHVEALGSLSIGGPPVQRDSLFRIASTTKPITGAVTMALIDDGRLELDEPVTRLLPELASPRVLRRMDGPLDDAVPAAREITVRDLLTFVLGKGAKPADIPLPIPVLRAVREAVDGRSTGPILRTRTGRRMDRAGASRALTRVADAAGIIRPISAHGLRRTFCTTGLVAGISIRDMQYAMRHDDPRTTMRYDMAKANLDRHAAHAVAAYLAGMSTG